MTYSVELALSPEVTGFFDKASSTITYVIRDPQSASCAIIDAVLDFDYASGRTGYESADEIVAFVKSNSLQLEWILETHVHADHLSAAPYIKAQLGGKLGISENIRVVQDVFGKVFNEGSEFQRDGSQFDSLFVDSDTYMVGSLAAFVMHTPGHTPACITHVIGDAVFVGDTLFMPDVGTARADFPGGDAQDLYRSIKKILTLPESMRLFMCHDYAPDSRNARWQTTVAEQRASNIHVHDGITEAEFVALRNSRDKTLGKPRLIIPSLQVNMRAGHLPEAESNGTHYLKVPVNML